VILKIARIANPRYPNILKDDKYYKSVLLKVFIFNF